MYSYHTQEISPGHDIKHIFQKVNNGKYENCDLDYLKQRRIWKSLSKHKCQKSYYQRIGPYSPPQNSDWRETLQM